MFRLITLLSVSKSHLYPVCTFLVGAHGVSVLSNVNAWFLSL